MGRRGKFSWAETRADLIERYPTLTERLPEQWEMGIDLRGVNFAYAELNGMHLRGVNLRGGCLIHAGIAWADLREADLREADFHRAFLSYSNLEGADLRGANLYITGFAGANLQKTLLEGAKIGWDSRNLISEILWQAARTPEQEQFSAWVGRKTDLHWKQWQDIDHPALDWALDELSRWVDGDWGVPEILKSNGQITTPQHSLRPA